MRRLFNTWKQTADAMESVLRMRCSNLFGVHWSGSTSREAPVMERVCTRVVFRRFLRATCASWSCAIARQHSELPKRYMTYQGPFLLKPSLGPTFLCCFLYVTVHAIFAGRLRWWNSDLVFLLMNKNCCTEKVFISYQTQSDITVTLG